MIPSIQNGVQRKQTHTVNTRKYIPIVESKPFYEKLTDLYYDYMTMTWDSYLCDIHFGLRKNRFFWYQIANVH